jgi:hypothetical protein
VSCGILRTQYAICLSEIDDDAVMKTVEGTAAECWYVWHILALKIGLTINRSL